jgi:hypothetical protein
MPRGILIACLLAAGACRAGGADRPEDAQELLLQLARDVPLAREEGIERVARRAGPVREWIESVALPEPQAGPAVRKRALDYLEEDEGQLRLDLERALVESTPERRVWEAHHAARRACLGRVWGHLEPALRRQGLGWKERYEPDDRVTFYRFVLPRVPKESLFFWVKVIRGGSGPAWVSEVFVGLLFSFGVPFAQAAQDARFGPGSVLSLFLGHPAVREIATLYPTLEEIELAYGRIRDREKDLVPSGFHVNASFLAVPEGSGGRGVYGTVESRLDPLESSDGRWLTEGFRAEERWGEFVERGRSLWGLPPQPR